MPTSASASVPPKRLKTPRTCNSSPASGRAVHRTVRADGALASLHRVAPPAKRSALADWRLGDLESHESSPRRSEQLEIRLALAPLLHRPKGNSVKLSIWPVGAIGFASGLESRAANPQRRRTRSGGQFIREATRASQAYAPSQSQAIARDRDAIEVDLLCFAPGTSPVRAAVGNKKSNPRGDVRMRVCRPHSGVVHRWRHNASPTLASCCGQCVIADTMVRRGEQSRVRPAHR